MNFFFRWVSNVTENLLPSQFVNENFENTKVMLISTLLMKANWEQRFDASTTKNDTFYTTNVSPVPIKMMKTTASVRIVKIANLNATALELPYTGEKV